MKRPRAPIACFRCHHKKVRCDGAHPYCTRCQSTGSSCSYPSSRRSRNTQPHHVDPYIDHLSQLEHQIRQIEADMNDYRNVLFSTLPPTGTTSSKSSAQESNHANNSQEDMLRSHLSKTEQEVQESRTILAQLRLRGEQRIARTKRNQTKEAKQQQQQQHRTSSASINGSSSDIHKKRSATRSSSKLSKNDASSSSSLSASTSSTSSFIQGAARVATTAPMTTAASHRLGSSANTHSHGTSSAIRTVNGSAGFTTYSTASSLQHMTPFLPLGTSHYSESSPMSAAAATSIYANPIQQTPSSATLPSTSYHSQQYQPHTHSGYSSSGLSIPTQSTNDLYYLAAAAGSEANAPTYYDPLMDYPWTTPADFDTSLDSMQQQTSSTAPSSSSHTDSKTNVGIIKDINNRRNHNVNYSSSKNNSRNGISNNNYQDSDCNLDNKSIDLSLGSTDSIGRTSSHGVHSTTDSVLHQESVHYSTSTVAAIEEATRLAQQLHRSNQNHQSRYQQHERHQQQNRTFLPSSSSESESAPSTSAQLTMTMTPHDTLSGAPILLQTTSSLSPPAVTPIVNTCSDTTLSASDPMTTTSSLLDTLDAGCQRQQQQRAASSSHTRPHAVEYT